MRRPHGRNIHGILLLDKPQGLSSNNALQKVKSLYDVDHAGHTGTLDSLATGMLPICFGEATKFSQFLLNADKRYRVIAKFGQRTDTSDAEGKIIQERPVSFTKSNLDSALNYFSGTFQQIPSMYSAVKFQGKKLYEYARQGITVPRKARIITVYQKQVIRCENNELELEIHCSKGTYIRTIIDDLGELLGCGAHVIYLRRLQVSTYPMRRMVTLEKLNAPLIQKPISLNKWLDSFLIPMDSPLEHYPEVNLLTTLATHLKHGQSIQVSGTINSGIVRLTEGENHTFIGIGTITNNGIVTPLRLLSNICIK